MSLLDTFKNSKFAKAAVATTLVASTMLTPNFAQAADSNLDCSKYQEYVEAGDIVKVDDCDGQANQYFQTRYDSQKNPDKIFVEISRGNLDKKYDNQFFAGQVKKLIARGFLDEPVPEMHFVFTDTHKDQWSVVSVAINGGYVETDFNSNGVMDDNEMYYNIDRLMDDRFSQNVAKAYKESRGELLVSNNLTALTLK